MSSSGRRRGKEVKAFKYGDIDYYCDRCGCLVPESHIVFWKGRLFCLFCFSSLFGAGLRYEYQ